MTTIKVLVLGSTGVGKSALVVRYLTKRFIGEYTSRKDILYHCQPNCDELPISAQILDCSKCENADGLPSEDAICWSDAIIVVYSICHKGSFNHARQFIQHVKQLKNPSHVPIMLLGNKTDLDHRREVKADESEKLSMEFKCQFQELSAADGHAQVSIAFNALFRETLSWLNEQSLKRKRSRRNSLKSVSQAIASVFGKVPKSPDSNPDCRVYLL